MCDVTMFSHLTDEHVEQILNDTASAIMKVHGMSHEEREKPHPKGTSPIQAVQLSAHFFRGAAKELEARGRLPKGWLEAND